MNRYNLLLATVAAAFVAGCVSAPVTNSAGRALDDKPRVTGSCLSASETSASVKSIRNQQEITDVMQRSSTIGTGGGI
jgi:hypothetical protein